MNDRSTALRPRQPKPRIPLSRGELRRRFEASGERRTALVTGATGSIGRIVSARLAGMVDTLLVHGRNQHLLAELAATLAPANPGTSIVPVSADLGSFPDVRRLTHAIEETFGRLDILVNNAATLGHHGRTLTRDGHELTFQVNYMSPVLITADMFHLLKAAKDGRVVNVVCGVYRHGKAVILDLSATSRYHPVTAYAQSKFALVAHTACLYQSLAGKPCSAVCVDPGVVDTKLRTNLFQTPDVAIAEAADNVLYGITMPASSRGFYVRGKKLVQPEPEVLRSSLRRQLVQATEERLEMHLPWAVDGATNSPSGGH